MFCQTISSLALRLDCLTSLIGRPAFPSLHLIVAILFAVHFAFATSAHYSPSLANTLSLSSSLPRTSLLLRSHLRSRHPSGLESPSNLLHDGSLHVRKHWLCACIYEVGKGTSLCTFVPASSLGRKRHRTLPYLPRCSLCGRKQEARIIRSTSAHLPNPAKHLKTLHYPFACFRYLCLKIWSSALR